MKNDKTTIHFAPGMMIKTLMGIYCIKKIVNKRGKKPIVATDPAGKEFFFHYSQAEVIIPETTMTASMVQAQEEAYFDNFCQSNNI